MVSKKHNQKRRQKSAYWK